MIKFDSYVSVKIYLECPKCAHTIETELPALVHAMNGNREVFCSGCERKFKLKVELLDPRSPTLREADGDTCPSCSGYGSYLVGAYHETCPECEGTGHV